LSLVLWGAIESIYFIDLHLSFLNLFDIRIVSITFLAFQMGSLVSCESSAATEIEQTPDLPDFESEFSDQSELVTPIVKLKEQISRVKDAESMQWLASFCS
jgi:hypothetical protein